MYNIDLISEELKDLLGFYQNEDPNGTPQLQEDLLVSTSFMYYQDEHPLVTLRNLYKIAPEFSEITYDAYVPGDDYEVGNKAAFNSKNWIALVDNTGVEPGTDDNVWQEYDAFSDWLRKRVKTSIVKVVEDFVKRKEVLKKGSAIFEDKVLYTGTGRMTDLISNSDLFVGLNLELSRQKGALVKIPRVSFQFDGPVDFNLYVFHSSQTEPIQITPISYTKTNSVQWFDLGLDIKHFNTEIDAGGIYTVGYYQSDLGTVKALNKVVNWYDEPTCSHCNQTDFNNYKLRSKHLSVYAVGAPEGVKGELFDINQLNYWNDRNYGMNMEVSVYCDFTDFIIEQKDMLKAAISKQFAIKVLERLIYNPEDDIDRAILTKNAARITYDLNGTDEDKSNSLRSRYLYDLKSIDFSTDGINRLCLKCNPKGVTYGSI